MQAVVFQVFDYTGQAYEDELCVRDALVSSVVQQCQPKYTKVLAWMPDLSALPRYTLVLIRAQYASDAADPSDRRGH